MSDIIGCIGKIPSRKFIINGLKRIDYRGYDSAGIAFAVDGEIKIYKAIGQAKELDKITPKSMRPTQGIGHIRWASHGGITIDNCHPVTSNSGLITLVHAGSIENCRILRETLRNKDFEFKGDTDSEVVANLIEFAYNFRAHKDIIETIKYVMKYLEGSYSIAFLLSGDTEHIYILKKQAPLFVGKGVGFHVFASNIECIENDTNLIYSLKDSEFGVLSKYDFDLFDEEGKEIKPEFVKSTRGSNNHELGSYKHYFLKETDEIPGYLQKIYSFRKEKNNPFISKQIYKVVRDASHIIVTGCGSSLYPALMAGRLFIRGNKFVTATSTTEWNYSPIAIGSKPVHILLSQSGETLDVLKALKISKKKHITTIGITNVKGSSLAVEADYSIFLDAGEEVAISETKSYFAETAVLGLLTAMIAGKENEFYKTICTAMNIIEDIQENKKVKIEELAKQIKNYKNITFIGRELGYDASRAGSFIFKPLTRIYTDAIPIGEVKYSALSYLDKNSVVIGSIFNPYTAPLDRICFEQIKARGAKLIVISCKSLSEEGDDIVVDDINHNATTYACAPIYFYLAYYTCLELGLDPDRPRNLSKSVFEE